MKTYNLGTTRDTYYKQGGSGAGRNEIDPNSTCKPTSVVEGLAIAGWEPWRIIAGAYRQPEDNLTNACRGLAADSVKVKAGIDRATPGNEVWEVVAEIVNGVFYGGRSTTPIIGPRYNWNLKEVLWGIAMLERPFEASTWLAKAGHIVTMKGFSTSQEDIPTDWRELDLMQISEIIIDDPAGRPMGNGHYDFDADGWNVKYTLAGWDKYWRATGVQIRNAGEVA